MYAFARNDVVCLFSRTFDRLMHDLTSIDDVAYDGITRWLPGDVCAARDGSSWYRVEILSVKDTDKRGPQYKVPYHSQ